MTQLQLSTETTTNTANPLVSVIISNHNYGRYLSQAIESVLNQTYRNFELIVVDDGSSDNSREVITNYGDRLIAIFQDNAGQGVAFNAGIAKSCGEIICFLDADDYYQEDKLAKVVAAFATHPHWVQVSHGWTSVNQAGLTIGKGSDSFSQGDLRNLLLQWGKYALGITSAISYRRAALQQALPIPTKRTEAADTYLTVTVPFFGEVGGINEPLMFYRIHGKNRRAHSDNVARLIHQRELTATYTNAVAARVGLSERFDLQRDPDYLSFKALEQGGGSWQAALRIINLTFQETRATNRSPKDTLERLLRRSICTLFPEQGMAVLRLGLRGYLRSKLSGKEPTS